MSLVAILQQGYKHGAELSAGREVVLCGARSTLHATSAVRCGATKQRCGAFPLGGQFRRLSPIRTLASTMLDGIETPACCSMGCDATPHWPAGAAHVPV